MKSDHAAHLSLVQDAEKNHVAQHQVKAANKAERQRKQSVNMQFWHSMKEIIFMIVCAAIVIYTLIHFAG